MSDLASNSKLDNAAKSVGDRVQGHQLDRVPGYDPFETVRHHAYGNQNESCSVLFAGKQPFQECHGADDKGLWLTITPIYPHAGKDTANDVKKAD